jgi:hypothetical protein
MGSSPLRPLADKILRALHECSKSMQELGFPSLGNFIIRSIEQIQKKGESKLTEGPSAIVLLEHIVNALPAMQDVSEYKGKKV